MGKSNNRVVPKKERESMLTQDHLKEVLHYDEITGLFTWKTRKQGVTLGARAGWVDTDGYPRIMIDRRRYMSHTLAFLYMEGAFPKNEVDHLNHNRSDNSWVNLRKVTRVENSRNLSLNKNNTSGHTGVYWDKSSLKYKSQIKLNGDYKHLGSYPKIKDAIQARKEAEIKYGFHENHGKE